MKTRTVTLLSATALAALVLTTGCAYYGANLRPGVSTEAEVRRDMGVPAEVYDETDGSKLLAFPRGPLGVQTFIARISSDGRLQSLEQVLNEAHFDRIVVGRTTKDEVRRLIGPPCEVMQFRRLNQVAWTYRFRDGYSRLADFSVMLDPAGTVVRTVIVPLDTPPSPGNMP
jgi:outer membrane protein assembly factor BamE (lipoprotein component of BamABCDE complex)